MFLCLKQKTPIYWNLDRDGRSTYMMIQWCSKRGRRSHSYFHDAISLKVSQINKYITDTCFISTSNMLVVEHHFQKVKLLSTGNSLVQQWSECSTAVSPLVFLIKFGLFITNIKALPKTEKTKWSMNMVSCHVPIIRQERIAYISYNLISNFPHTNLQKHISVTESTRFLIKTILWQYSLVLDQQAQPQDPDFDE